MVTATAVVAMYRPMVLPPMRDSFLKSESEATPATREVSTSGTAINLSKFMKMSPNGTIQSLANSLHWNFAAMMPKISPSTIPRMICQ